MILSLWYHLKFFEWSIPIRHSEAFRRWNFYNFYKLRHQSYSLILNAYRLMQVMSTGEKHLQLSYICMNQRYIKKRNLLVGSKSFYGFFGWFPSKKSKAWVMDFFLKVDKMRSMHWPFPYGIWSMGMVYSPHESLIFEFIGKNIPVPWIPNGYWPWWSMSIARWEVHTFFRLREIGVKEKKQNLLQIKHLLKFTPAKLTWDPKMGGICRYVSFSKGPKYRIPY